MGTVKTKIVIHGFSLALGAGITSAVIIITFLVINEITDESELVINQVQSQEDFILSKALTEIINSNQLPILGNPDAPITLVEFGDYQCHFCNVHFHNTEHNLLKNFISTGKVKMIFKDYTIIGPDSVNAAHGTHCANDQGKFWEYHDILYNNWKGENNGWASSENLLKFAQDINLDVDLWSDCMIKATHSQIVSTSSEVARDLGLTGTPGFFVVGPNNDVTKIFGAQPYENFERVFNVELEKQS